MRHGVRMAAVAVVASTLLSGCFGSSSPEPTSADTGSQPGQSVSPSDTPSSTPTSRATSEPTTAPTSGSTSGSVLGFSPKSNGRHSHTCLAITGTDPVDYIYYPVMVQASSPVTLDSASVTYADGVQVAGSWVAPAAETGGTGIVEGWPAPAILVQGSSVQWKKRVPAAGANLDPDIGWYNVFLHLRVYPDALPLKTDGVVLTYHDTAGDETVTWVDHLSFQKTC